MTATFNVGDGWVVETPGHWTSTCIRIATRGRKNHAGLIVEPDGTSVAMCPDGLKFWKGAAVLCPIPANATVITPLNEDGSPLRTSQRNVIRTLALHAHEAHVRYNWPGLLALAMWQHGIRTLWARHKLADTTDEFCSQLVDDCWTLAGVHAFNDGRPSGDVSPEDLDDAAEQLNWPTVHLGKERIVL